MRYSVELREEALKNKVAADFFSRFDCTNILGNVDFSCCVIDHTPTLFDNDFLLWGEAKRGKIADFKTSFVQLILTIGKERTFDKYLPPKFLCEFDASQIAFLPYDVVLEVFYQNDFNWMVAPSDHTTKEFRQLYALVEMTLQENSYIYSFDRDEKILRDFIRANVKVTSSISRAKITKNNFISIYGRWLEAVRPHISVPWDSLRKAGIIDADFFLADIMSKDNAPIMEKLQVLLVKSHYVLMREVNRVGLFSSSTAEFDDEGKAHAQFWMKYERPPKKEYQEYIVTRRDLLVPQDIRERKGSYFTPKKWVELAQKYLADVLGENWQDEYYVWDCCAGTGNLLAGLSDKYKIYASTLDKSDVDVMQERIRNGANLLPDHVFQFDFLNDGYRIQDGNVVSYLVECGKLPDTLRDILRDEDKRSRLVVFINPPCAESANKSLNEDKKDGVAVNTLAYRHQQSSLGLAARDLYAQFIYRIYEEVRPVYLAEFSKLKHIQSPAFEDFRKIFKPKFESGFVVSCDTFDNVKGKFPYGFMIWNCFLTESELDGISLDVYSRDSVFSHSRYFSSYRGLKSLNDWIITTRKRVGETVVGYVTSRRHDVQGIRYVYLINGKDYVKSARGTVVTDMNLREIAVYFAVQLAPEFGWLNDLDQFVYPDERCMDDLDFVSDCFAFMLFHGQNRITKEFGKNTWTPFSEEEVCSRERFDSHFMYDFLHGRSSVGETGLVGELPGFGSGAGMSGSLSFSSEATAVMDAGRELWRYYHSQPGVDVNASLYDIRAYFQGFKPDKNGKMVMNSDSPDIRYTELIGNLRSAMKVLAARIEPKVYEYGFLKR